MTDQIAGGGTAILVHVHFSSTEFNEDLDEFIELVRSADIHPVSVITGRRSTPNARYFIGSGKVAEIKEIVKTAQPEVVIINHEISPAQERNLERELGCRVIDRVRLILDIFAQRARSYEGKLQVELAQLQHLSTRLVRGWTHLERQKGGIGLRGPGESQLETDRRLIGKRIKSINARLDKVRSQREQSAKQRSKSDIPVISLVGYTNAGKSTLFNRLTGAEVYAADKLFATLDPTLRKVNIAPEVEVILTDTVGFIRHIPHDLIDAFHATLEETRQADLLLHVIDANDPQRHAHIDQVNQVITEIGASHVPQIEIYNKIDLQPAEPRMETSESGKINRIWLSARTGAGIELLREALRRFIPALSRSHRLNLPPSAGKLRAHLFQIGAVREEHENADGGWVMDVSMDTPRLHKLCEESGVPVAGLQ